ncbi:MAG: hypothetical protein JWP94_580 [Mucilaginibacter sp.]|nr:hypothetical protein [Mucilaginibacter sp.]
MIARRLARHPCLTVINSSVHAQQKARPHNAGDGLFTKWTGIEPAPPLSPSTSQSPVQLRYGTQFRPFYRSQFQFTLQYVALRCYYL